MTTTATPFIPVLRAGPTAEKLIERHRTALEGMGPVFQNTASKRTPDGTEAPETAYHLSLPQMCFLAAKMDEPIANRQTALMADVFALFCTGRLLAADPLTASELAAAQMRAVLPTA